jgi:hypothetical protein
MTFADQLRKMNACPEAVAWDAESAAQADIMREHFSAEQIDAAIRALIG